MARRLTCAERQARIAEIRERIAAGQGPAKIARALCIDKNSLASFAHTHGILLLHSDKSARNKAIRAARAAGKSVAEIVAQFGISATTVKHVARGVEPAGVVVRNAETAQRVRQLIREGQSAREVAVATGYNHAFIKRLRADMIEAAKLATPSPPRIVVNAFPYPPSRLVLSLMARGLSRDAAEANARVHRDRRAA